MKRLGSVLALALVSCAPIPPPDVLGKLDAVRSAPAALEARAGAPSAFAHAEQLREQAYAALEASDDAGAQILGERAEVAYAHAVALGRVARADRERIEVEAEAQAAEQQLAELDAEHQRVEADIVALGTRLALLREAEPIAPSPEASGAREQARREAAASLGVEARLLCGAASLLAITVVAERPDWRAPSELAAAVTAERELGATLAAAPPVAPVDGAMRARAGCLQALTLVRRGLDAPGAVGADAVLAELSRTGAGPSRDDRGVVVTLRAVFDGEELRPAARRALEAIGTSARAWPGMPLMVVLHGADASQAGVSATASVAGVERGRKIVALLEQLTGRRLPAAELAGTASPVVDPKGQHKAENERVEVVVVTRELL